MEVREGIKVMAMASAEEWRNWLTENHAIDKKAWVIIYNNNNPSSITYDEAVDEAICYGWIDGKAVERNDNSDYVLFGRRSPKRNWFTTNRGRAERLMAQNRITEAGLRTIEISKQNGTWEALEEAENVIIPLDFLMALEAYEQAGFNFDKFPESIKVNILKWIFNAKSPHTRNKRIEEAASMADKNVPATKFRKPI
jgi:uncharacterized protein YdeI (YjbR/CyaY-like superfamily)